MHSDSTTVVQTNKIRKQNIQSNTSKEITTTLFVLTKNGLYAHSHIHIHVYIHICALAILFLQTFNLIVPCSRPNMNNKNNDEQRGYVFVLVASWLFNCVRFTKETHLFIYV